MKKRIIPGSSCFLSGNNPLRPTFQFVNDRFVLSILIVLLTGFALRVYRLGDANVWWDEAYSVWLARKPLLEGIRITSLDVHPPLFYMLLNGWMRLAGGGEFGARYLSALIGSFTIAALYPLGARFFGRRWAIFGMLLLSVSRFHIWWSQEIRMYSLAACLVVFSFSILIRQVGNKPLSWGWMFYMTTIIAVLHTLYLAALVIPAAGFSLLILWMTKRISRRAMINWMGAIVIVGLFFVPWIIYSDPSRPGQASSGNVPFQFFITLYLTLLSTGNSTEIGRYTVIVLSYGLVIAGAIVGLVYRRKWIPFAFLTPPIILPPLMAILLTFVQTRFYTPALEARYYLLFTPVNLLLSAGAVSLITRWQKWAGWVLMVGIITLSLAFLPAYYSDRYLRDQWKSATQIINAYAMPGDSVVVVSGDRYPLFLYEYEQMPDKRPPVRLMPDGVPILTQGNIGPQMKQSTSGATRVWLVEIEAGIQDPDGLARKWLEERMNTVLQSNFDYNRLALYSSIEEVPTISLERYSPQIHLENSPILGIDLPIRHYRPGDVIHLGVYADSGNGSINMIHEQGKVLAKRMFPSRSANLFLRYDVTFPVNQAIPKGTYVLKYEDSPLITIEVEETDPLWQEKDIPNLRTADVGDAIKLLGYEMAPPEPQPGDQVQVDLFWRAISEIEEGYTVFVQIVGPHNPANGIPIWGQHDTPPVGGTFLTNSWPVGLIIRDQHKFVFDADAPAADYALLVGMYLPDTGQRLPIAGNPDGALTLQNFSTN